MLAHENFLRITVPITLVPLAYNFVLSVIVLTGTNSVITAARSKNITTYLLTTHHEVIGKSYYLLRKHKHACRFFRFAYFFSCASRVNTVQTIGGINKILCMQQNRVFSTFGNSDAL